MKKHTLFILLLFVAGWSHAQTTSENYIQSTSCLDADCIRKTETVQYFDYLGRPRQIIGVKASPTGKDVVTPIEYDLLGRQVKDYLPIPQSATQNGEIYASPLSNAAVHYGSEKIYAEKVLENSPLERVQQQIHVGNDWSNKPVTFGYDANTTADAVKKFTALTTETTVTENGVFGNGQLQKNTVTDEDGNISIEFKNGWGQTILLRKMLNGTKADTYYVYNEYDRLAFVLPPLASNAPTLSPANLDALCYQYRYDGKYNLVEKKIPGKGWEYMVYDQQNRLIMTRDTNMEAAGQWLFTKYDKFGRVAYTGIATGGTRVTEQTNVDNAGSNTVTRTTAVGFTHEVNVYYTNTGYPATMTDLLSVNYYDTYPPEAPALPTQIMGQEVLKQSGQSGALKNTKSLPLASYLKTIEIGHSWTINYSYYDTKGRAVASHSINHLGGYTKTEVLLDFAGMPQQTKTYQKRSDEDVTETMITENFEYDAQNRMTKHYHQVNGQPQELLTEHTYNELSQLSNKKTGNNLQSIDYAYNIRGWMTKINDPANLSNKLFGYDIKYQNGANARYNGNISQIDWKTSNDGVLRRYSYQYDALSRLQNAVYSEPNSSVPANNFFNETIAYDLNGNITSLHRNSKGASGFAEQIDQLTYAYNNNNLSNTLNTVTDTSQNYKGYPDVSGNTMTYDDNGNLKTHKDKGILNIQYNYLNLPNYMVFDRTYFSRNRVQNENVYNYYRADGVKLRKEHRYSENSSYTLKTTEYLDGFQYEVKSISASTTPILKFVSTSEGYFNFENNKYIYSYTDHLGNIRVSYFKNSNGSAEVLEENNYYPFGMKHEGYNVLAGNPAYNYGYNNKELQKETGWNDYGARMYMPEIGRWGVIDPLAEVLRRHTPYNYGVNNPVMFIDPDGRLSQSFIDGMMSSGSGVHTNTGNGFSNGLGYDGRLGGNNKASAVNLSLGNNENTNFNAFNIAQFGGGDSKPKRKYLKNETKAHFGAIEAVDQYQLNHANWIDEYQGTMDFLGNMKEYFESAGGQLGGASVGGLAIDKLKTIKDLFGKFKGFNPSLASTASAIMGVVGTSINMEADRVDQIMDIYKNANYRYDQLHKQNTSLDKGVTVNVNVIIGANGGGYTNIMIYDISTHKYLSGGRIVHRN